MSVLSGAIMDRREITVQVAAPDANGSTKRTLRPAVMMIRPPRVQLAAWPATPVENRRSDKTPEREHATDEPLELIDIDRIEKLQLLDSRFTPPPIDLTAIESLADDSGR